MFYSFYFAISSIETILYRFVQYLPSVFILKTTKTETTTKNPKYISFELVFRLRVWNGKHDIIATDNGSSETKMRENNELQLLPYLWQKKMSEYVANKLK